MSDEEKDTLVDAGRNGAPQTREAPTLLREISASVHTSVGESPLRQLGFADRYQTRRLLGEGGMGRVDLCDDLVIGRAIAMKVSRHGRAGGETAERFLREARIQGQLEHPAVVPVYDIGVDPEGAVYFTMKRVRGTTLLDVVNGLRTAPEAFQAKYGRHRLLGAFGSVCLAVDFAHRHGVIHRDLKPANVMLGDYGEVYVLDWGLARVGDEDRSVEVEPLRLTGSGSTPTQTGVVMGTPGYMSPEQARGQIEALGAASDVYSLGAILFEILTSKPLHDAPNTQSMIASTIAGAEPRPSLRAPELEIAPELEAVVVKATALDPAERYHSARELFEAIERYLEGERDQSLRSEMAAKHSERAEIAVARARTGTSLGLHRDRRAALREIGRALALDPDNERALGLLMKLLNEPPTVLPKEVKSELAAVESQKLRYIAKIAGFGYAHVILYLPFLLWVGVRRWDWIAVLFLAAFAASALSFRAASQPEPSRKLALAVLVLGNLSFVATSAMFGPLFFTPTFIAVNATGFALYFDAFERRVGLATAAAALLIPLALWALGWLPGGYGFGAAGISILPGAIGLAKTPVVVFVTLTNLGAIAVGTLTVMHVREALHRLERQLLVYAWQLREFVPIAARAATDPKSRQLSAKSA